MAKNAYSYFSISLNCTAQNPTKDDSVSLLVNRERSEEYYYKEHGLLYVISEVPEEEDQILSYDTIFDQFSTNLEAMMQQNRKWMRDCFNPQGKLKLSY